MNVTDNYVHMKSVAGERSEGRSRSLILSPSNSNQTVLHQFCCPAPEVSEGEPSTACVPRRSPEETLELQSVQH
ncbi:unnamed protein product [Arctogadus glacialis]